MAEARKNELLIKAYAVLGLVMLLAGVGATLGLLGQYLKQVTSQRYPGGKRGREQEL